MDYPLFYNSVNDDRSYDADSFSDWLKKFFTTGVFNGELQVTASGGMGISVSAGYVNINGKVMMFEQTPLTVGTADGTYYRIDSVIIERNDTDRQFYIKIVQGTTGTESSVTGVTPVRSGAVYQLIIARIKVRPGATAITQADITDTRANASLCGYVAGTVTQMDFSQFQAQFDAYLEAFKTGQQADFETWFAGLQTTLDGDVAGHLQNEIDTKADATAVTGKVSKSGDTMSGNLAINKENTSGAARLEVVANGAHGDMRAVSDGNFGLYDLQNLKYLIRSDSDGYVHSDISAKRIWSYKSNCASVSTSYTYFQRAELAQWNMILIRFTVHEQQQMCLFVRGESHERSITDWPAAGKFRGGIYVDWANNRIGLRCLNAGTNNNRPDLVYFDYIYGVL